MFKAGELYQSIDWRTFEVSSLLLSLSGLWPHWDNLAVFLPGSCSSEFYRSPPQVFLDQPILTLVLFFSLR